MSGFEEQIKDYHEGIEKLKVLEPNLITSYENIPNNTIGLLNDYLQELTNLSNLNTDITNVLTDIDIARDELFSLRSTKESLDYEIFNLKKLPIPLSVTPDPLPSSPDPQFNSNSESIKFLKSKISEIESEINSLKVSHPLNLITQKQKYINELQVQKNRQRQEKFFSILTKLTLSHEASVHNFITREELQEDLSKQSQSNRTYTEQLQKASIISMPKPTIPSPPLPEFSSALRTILICLICFLIPLLIQKLIRSNNTQTY